jgi:hypothetical protein
MYTLKKTGVESGNWERISDFKMTTLFNITVVMVTVEIS